MPHGPTGTPDLVHYVTVTAADGEIVGYVWGDATGVGWVQCPAGRGDSLRAGTQWHDRARELHGRGLAPRGVLSLLSREPGIGPVTGAADVAAIEDMARVPTPDPEGHPLDQGGGEDVDVRREPTDDREGSLLMCRFCGGSPAADVTFRAHRGLVVLMGFQKSGGPMCMTCGLAVYRAYTTHTLCVGWWSPLSLFVFAPLTLVRNVLAVRRVKRLPAPGPGTLGPRHDPGVPVRRRPRAYVALVPALWVLFMIVTGLSGGV
ncbi:hypothetical protein AB0O67_32990 [Streptomyces sp. NPDC086077]|uniref:hypothetical protein n=1 Tax=Streptomyces sp. NPDC086077 TaxID=3154862 RepID=UPI003448A906